MLALPKHTDAIAVEDARLRELPYGWTITTLGEACIVIQGQSPPGTTYNTKGTGLPFLQGKAEFADLYPTAIKWCSAPSKVADPGDVLISIRAPVGPTNLCAVKSCIGRGLAAIRPLGGVPSRYALYALRATEEELRSRSTGTTFEAVRGDHLRSHVLPLAPLAEQHRIVAEIEKQFTRLDASIAALKRVQTNLKRYRASVLKAACEGKLVPTEAELAQTEGRDYEPADRLLARILTERRARWESQEKRGRKYKEPAVPDTSNLPKLPEGWVWATVNQVSHRIQYGTSSKAGSDASGIPVLRMGNIRDGDLDLSDLKYLSVENTDVQKTLLEHGDLLFNRTNSAELVGKCAVFKGAPSQACFASYLIRVSLDGLLSDFACAYINSEHGRRYIIQVRSQQVGQANVNGTKLAAMPIAIPPLAEQHRIVAEVDRRLSVIQQAEAAVEANLARADRLRQSILKQAFSGQLVPQDPSDEPAPVLLERIRAEREAAQAAAKSKRKPRRRRARPRTEPVLQEGAS